MNIRAYDSPNLTLVTDLSNMFRLCSNLDANFGNWDISTILNLSSMFWQAASFNNGGSSTVGDGRANVSDIYDEKIFVVSVGTRTDSGSASVHIYGWIGTTTASAGVIVYDVPVITTNNTCTTFRLDDYYYFIAAGLNTGGSGTMTGCSVRCSAVNYKR